MSSIHLKMKEIFRFFTYLALVIHCQGKADHERDKRAGEPDYPIEEYLENCGMTQKITPEKSFKFGTPYFGIHQYPASVECSWSFVGDDTCKVSITCPTLDLRKEADCEEEHLEILDGLGGRQKFCSGQQVDQIEARNNGHDLFVRLKTMERSTFDRYYKGIFCQVSCNTGGKTKLALDPHYFSENHRCECGTFGGENSNDRIVGGQDAVFNEFPWQAAIVLSGTRKPKCGASVINTRWLLSAAHCFAFESAKPEDYEILVHARVLDVVNTGPGKLIDTQRNENLGNVTDQDEGTRRYKIKEIITHPLFTSKYDYDVALIKIATSIDLSGGSAINPICLPELSFPPRDFTGDIVIVSGWGKSDQDAATTMRALQKLEVPVISRPICQELLHNRLTDRMFCAGIVDGGKDACQGDSGGPLIWKNVSSGRFIQIGIVSWGDGCAQYKRPGIYTEVTDVNQWIHTFAASGVWCSG